MKKILVTTVLALAGVALAGAAHADGVGGLPDSKGALKTVGDTVTGVTPSPSKEVVKTALDVSGDVAGGIE
ncbi:hypothetical protein ACFV0B_27150 [Streptomyces xanthophaeus]|uniref:hypothetical protein n=1 Tax=Streptomyces xanthophaeus TaxID=67385 RepID=UPI0036B10064